MAAAASKDFSSQAHDCTLDIEHVTPKLSPRSPSEHSSDDDHERDELCAPSPSSPTSFCGGRGEEDTCCKTILAFIFLFYNMTLNLFILSIVHERVPTYIKQPLPDISFDALPKADWALDIAEYIIVAQVSLVFILLFIHRYRAIIFRRFCVILGILYLFRAICMISTVLPRANQNYYCSPQLFNSSDPSSSKITTGEYTAVIFTRVFHLLLGFGLSINGRHNYCGDYLYSGHTVIITITYLMLREYLMPSRCRTFYWKLWNVAVVCSSFVGIISISVSRGHYLIDILLAYYVTTRVFWMYHTLANNPCLRTSSSGNYLSRVWWWYLFKYFESVTHERRASPREMGQKQRIGPIYCNCDENLQVPRSFEWPLPWPRWLSRRSNRYRQRLLPTPAA